MILLLLYLATSAKACVQSGPDIVVAPANGSAVSETPVFFVFFSYREWSAHNSHIQVFGSSGAAVPVEVRWVNDVAEIRPRNPLHVGESYQIVLWPETAKSHVATGLPVLSSQVHVVHAASDPPPPLTLTAAPTRTPTRYEGDCGVVGGEVFVPVAGRAPFTVYAIWNRAGADESSAPDWWALGDSNGFSLGGGYLVGGAAPYGSVTVRALSSQGGWSAALEVATPPVVTTPDLPP